MGRPAPRGVCGKIWCLWAKPRSWEHTKFFYFCALATYALEAARRWPRRTCAHGHAATLSSCSQLGLVAGLSSEVASSTGGPRRAHVQWVAGAPGGDS